MSNRKARHLVHPRWVWAGLGIALAGVTVLGFGVATLSWTVSIIGTVIALAGSVLGVAVPAVVFLAEPNLLGHNGVGQANSLSDAGLALVIGLSGIGIAVGRGRQLVPAALAGLAAVGLLLGALLAPHEGSGVVVVEAACGVATILLAGAAILRPAKT